MRSNKFTYIQIQELLEQIGKLEPLIAAHKEANHLPEVKQYESLKLKFVKELLTLLVNSNLNAYEPKTFPLVHEALEYFYPKYNNEYLQSPEIEPIGSLLTPLFQRNKTSLC